MKNTHTTSRSGERGSAFVETIIALSVAAFMIAAGIKIYTDSLKEASVEVIASVETLLVEGGGSETSQLMIARRNLRCELDIASMTECIGNAPIDEGEQ